MSAGQPGHEASSRVPLARLLALAVMLAAFWVALSGEYGALLLAFGAGSVVFVAYIARRMDIVDHEGRPLELSLRAPGYWTWLGGQILLSAWDVTRRIWAHPARIAPVLRTTRSDGMSAVVQVTYANSITLTPGTLAVAVDDRGIEVHGLDASLIDDLDAGAMAKRVRRMELP